MSSLYSLLLAKCYDLSRAAFAKLAISTRMKEKKCYQQTKKLLINKK
jgi:hypothetical protein